MALLQNTYDGPPRPSTASRRPRRAVVREASTSSASGITRLLVGKAFVLFNLHNLYDGSPKLSNSVIRCSTASESRCTNPLQIEKLKSLVLVGAPAAISRFRVYNRYP